MSARREGGCVAVLLAGDLATLLIATVLGFVRHGEMQAVALPRIAATFLSFAAAWLLVSPWLRALDLSHLCSPRVLWRPVLAALLAAPTGAVLRGAWLGSPVTPVFVLVMGTVMAAMLLIWRSLFWLVVARRWAPAPRDSWGQEQISAPTHDA